MGWGKSCNSNTDCPGKGKCKVYVWRGRPRGKRCTCKMTRSHLQKPEYGDVDLMPMRGYYSGLELDYKTNFGPSFEEESVEDDENSIEEGVNYVEDVLDSVEDDENSVEDVENSIEDVLNSVEDIADSETDALIEMMTHGSFGTADNSIEDVQDSLEDITDSNIDTFKEMMKDSDLGPSIPEYEYESTIEDISDELFGEIDYTGWGHKIFTQL